MAEPNDANAALTLARTYRTRGRVFVEVRLPY